MVLLGSNVDPDEDQVEKIMDKNNVQGPAGDKEDLLGVKGGDQGEEELLKGEMEGFVSAQLEATAPRTMDKTMLRLNLKKPQVVHRQD